MGDSRKEEATDRACRRRRRRGAGRNRDDPGFNNGSETVTQVKYGLDAGARAARWTHVSALETAGRSHPIVAWLARMLSLTRTLPPLPSSLTRVGSSSLLRLASLCGVMAAASSRSSSRFHRCLSSRAARSVRSPPMHVRVHEGTQHNRAAHGTNQLLTGKETHMCVELCPVHVGAPNELTSWALRERELQVVRACECRRAGIGRVEEQEMHRAVRMVTSVTN